MNSSSEVAPAGGSDTGVVAPFPGDVKPSTVLQNGGFLHGIFLDPRNGPVQSGRRAVEPFEVGPDQVRVTYSTVIEDEKSPGLFDARYAHAGWPLPDTLPERPWSVVESKPQDTETGNWVTRRMSFQMWTISAQAHELRPVDSLSNAVNCALAGSTHAARISSLQEVFATWGDMIPLVAIVGASIAATGVLPLDEDLGSNSVCCRPRGQTDPRDLNSLVDAQLGIQGKFERRLKSHVQGGTPDRFLSGDLNSWLKTIGNATGWEIIKVIKAVPITSILDCTVQRKIKLLYANPGIIFRSPPVGVSRQFGFDGAIHGLRGVENIEIGCSDSRIERITVRYVGGLVAGPYGTSRDATRTDRFELARGEFVTDIFLWATDQLVSSIQLVKNTGHVSPIYGATRGITLPPTLSTGNGNALVGISGSYDTSGITQIQGVWRGDIAAYNFKRTQTSFAGGVDGMFWNDLRFMGDRATARISEITARSPATNFLGGLITTYTSEVGGYPIQQMAPVRGTDNAAVSTWALEDNEYIVGVRGRHDGTSICQLQFITNRPNRESPAFGMANGNFSFSFSPKTRDGKDMMLHYMMGKSFGRVNSILFVWAERVS